MTNPLLEHQTPDFAELERVLKGEQEPRRAHLVELGIDREVLQLITERYLGQPWVSPTKDPQEPYLEQLVTLYYRLGYDYVPTGPVWVHHPSPRRRRTEDTAALSRGEREWVDESRGLISSWKEFEQFPWDQIEPDCSPCEFAARNLPEGMKMTVTTTLYCFHPMPCVNMCFPGSRNTLSWPTITERCSGCTVAAICTPRE